MKHTLRVIFVALTIIVPTVCHGSGFGVGTLVKTPNGYIPIEHVSSGQHVISIDGHKETEGIVHAVRKQSYQGYMRVRIGDTSVPMALDQLVYHSQEAAWTPICLLQPGDCIAGVTNDICIEDIFYVQEPIDLYDLSVPDYHHYCVSECAIRVHNFFPAVIIGFGWAFGAGILEFAGATIGLSAFGLGLKYALTRTANNGNIAISVEHGLEEVTCSGSATPPEDPEKKKRERELARKKIRPLTNKEARELAQKMGFKEDKNPPFNTHRKLAFRNGNRWISPDETCHKGGVWKMFDKYKRIGTFTQDLTEQIGD